MLLRNECQQEFTRANFDAINEKIVIITVSSTGEGETNVEIGNILAVETKIVNHRSRSILFIN
jgi:hypothetical protein